MGQKGADPVGATGYKLLFTDTAARVLEDLGGHEQYSRKLKKIRKTLGMLESNPRHPGLRSHPYSSLRGVSGETVWDSYVENRTSSAWRIFWHYGPEPQTITVVAVGPHPD
jgi:hypothetical protein